jgi:hypothetical protein
MEETLSGKLAISGHVVGLPHQLVAGEIECVHPARALGIIKGMEVVHEVASESSLDCCRCRV